MTAIANTTKNFFNFTVDSLIDSRNFIRIGKASCLWFQHITNKTTLVFGKLTLDTNALNKKFLSPLDQQIGFINGINGILTLDECGKAWQESRYLAFSKHIASTFKDNLGGLKYLTACGCLVVLTPYLREIAIAKSMFGIAASLFEIALRIQDLIILKHLLCKPYYLGECSEGGFNLLKGRVIKNIFMIGIQICAFSLHTFVLRNAFLGPAYRASPLSFNIAGTCASLLGIGNSYVKYSYRDNTSS